MSVRAVAFEIGCDRYAFRAEVVREVVARPVPVRLPTAPPSLLGVFNLRGEVVPMFDLAALLGVGSLCDASVAIVVDTVSGPAGVFVSNLPAVVMLGPMTAVSHLRCTDGLYGTNDGLVVLVDVESLLLAAHQPSPSR